jgi:predicted transcriptional regulator
MTDEDILSELRTIRTLLTLDKEERLIELLEDLDEVQEDILEELEYRDWSSGFKENVAESRDVSKRTVQRGISDLIEKNLVEKRGAGRGVEYRKSGLMRAANLVNNI